MDISTSYPYLSIAKYYNADYGAVLLLAEATRGGDISIADALMRDDIKDMIASDLLPRQAGPILDMLEAVFLPEDTANYSEASRAAWRIMAPSLADFGKAMDDAANLYEFVIEYGGTRGLNVKDHWSPGCDWKAVIDKYDYAASLTSDDIPF